MTEPAPHSVARAARVLAAVLATVPVALAVMFPAATSAGAAPGTGPTLSVTPATGVLPGAQVGVMGAGFPPGAAVQVDECELAAASTPDPTRCTPIADSLLLAAPDGTVTGTATVVNGPVGTVPGAQCPAAPPQTCVLFASAVGTPGAEAVAPIAFDASVPVPPGPAAPPAAGAVSPPPAPLPARSAPRTGGTARAVVRAAATPAVAAAAPRPGRGSRPWAIGFGALVVAGALAGVGRAFAGQRRVRPA